MFTGPTHLDGLSRCPVCSLRAAVSPACLPPGLPVCVHSSKWAAPGKFWGHLPSLQGGPLAVCSCQNSELYVRKSEFIVHELYPTFK